jgi:hypothetical protein
VRVDADDQGLGIGRGGRDDVGAVTGTEVDDDLSCPIGEGSESADVRLDQPFPAQDAHADMMADSGDAGPGAPAAWPPGEARARPASPAGARVSA